MLGVNTNTDFYKAVPQLEDKKGFSKEEAAEVREKTDAFESLIIKMLLDNSMKDDKNIFTSQKDPGDKIYKSMYRDELSKSSAGSFGFSDMLFNYLAQNK